MIPPMTRRGEVRMVKHEKEERTVLTIYDSTTGDPLYEIEPSYIKGRGSVLIFWRRNFPVGGREHLLTLTTSTTQEVIHWLPVLLNMAAQKAHQQQT
jgi:hypothetical protein